VADHLVGQDGGFAGPALWVSTGRNAGETVERTSRRP
jgi:hypothetical protein